MRAIPSTLIAACIAATAIAACGPPKANTPIDQIPTLTKLTDVMDNQATVADPEFKKIDQTSYTDADYAAFTTVSQRIQATSLKIPDFASAYAKGSEPEFEALATRLNEKAKALGAAAAGKDAPGSSAALKDMKSTCKECHSKFR
ncbi:MAG TPA: cytochrome c [Polyangiaceae bacterium]|nr:cytochrome c [Polyangiaceae bacterium]